jgi:hypothetical protein
MPAFKKVVFWSSLYYTICYSISFITFVFVFVENLFSDSPPEKSLSYLFQLIVISLMIIFIYVNYQLAFKEINKKLLLINILFSLFQIISFKLSNISYLVCYGTNFGMMIGNKINYEFQLISILFFPQSIISTNENIENWFISVNFIPLLFIAILIYALAKMKKSMHL